MKRLLPVTATVLILHAGNLCAQTGEAINGYGSFTNPITKAVIKYKASASKSTNGNNTAKFLLRLCNTNVSPVSVVVCAMLDLKDKGQKSVPQYRIDKGATNWVCTLMPDPVTAPYNYHFGCKQVTIPGTGGTNDEVTIEVFKRDVAFSVPFDKENLGTVYMDFLSDCPVDASCTNFIGKDVNLIPGGVGHHTNWVNTWIGGAFFPVRPIPSDLLFSHNPVATPSGNWVTMGYPASYPARVLGPLRGAPAGSKAVFSFNGVARPAYVVPPSSGGETVVSIDERFVIPPVMTHDRIDLMVPAPMLDTVPEGSRVTFQGVVLAEPGAPVYAPGDLIYHWDVHWVHDTAAPNILYHSVNEFGPGVRVQAETRDDSSTPIDATFVYNSPETGERSVGIPFSDPATEGDIVHFVTDIEDLPYGISLDYHINVYDVFGNVSSTPEENLYLFGARVGVAREGFNVLVSWTTSDPQSRLAFNPALDRKNLWMVVPGTPTLQNGVYSMLLPIGNFPRFFELRAGLENPCPGGELLVRQAYSECNADGFWHVVEDNYYSCPGGQVRRFRVGDTKTDQPCGNGEAAPAVAGNLYRKLEGDETCQAPKQIGEIRIAECVGGIWEIATYNIYECLDGSRRISIPAKSRVRTNTPCSSPPPSPFV